MKDHETILKMIEEVDPNDTAKLDEIDRLVDEYEWNGVSQLLYPPQYTRSRDALKEIRPNGWVFTITSGNEPLVWCLKNGVQIKAVVNEFTTEELAELHAIIQSIAYERGEK